MASSNSSSPIADLSSGSAISAISSANTASSSVTDTPVRALDGKQRSLAWQFFKRVEEDKHCMLWP